MGLVLHPMSESHPGSALDVPSDVLVRERFLSLKTSDVRFPTSLELDGSDAMNPLPDYSAAYVELETTAGDHGNSLVFTIGRGTDVQVAAIEALAPLVVGREVDAVLGDVGAFARGLAADSPMRWLGPEKGVVHMAVGALVNAVWDLRARRAARPLWQELSELSPEEIVALVDFRHIGDALTPLEALDILRDAAPGRAERSAQLRADGYPAYSTTPGWLGYDDEKLVRLSREAVADGFELIKVKVGADVGDDIRRLGLVRDAVGADVHVAIDANQIWDVDQAIEWLAPLRVYDPYWIEEPTSPDDVLGHARIRRALATLPVATGEHVANRIVFKQLLQAEAVDVVQIDAARVGGVNENIAILLLAAKFGVPVCPHAGGVGLCEMVQHLSMFDYVAVSGTTEDRVIEYVDHLHEHFVDPVRIVDGHYLAPTLPGLSAQMHAASLKEYTYPDGPVWTARV